MSKQVLRWYRMHPTPDGLTFDVLAYTKRDAEVLFAEWVLDPYDNACVCRVVLGRRVHR
jgi:hypothetical protein